MKILLADGGCGYYLGKQLNALHGCRLIKLKIIPKGIY
jgi:hypothetical protein